MSCGHVCDYVIAEVRGGCQYGGVEYAVGVSYMEECNTCICLGDNEAACTRMFCGTAGIIDG